VANAGPDQNVSTGELVTLDGSASSDADGDTLTYLWSFVSVPAGSSISDASLSDPTAVNPTFTPDVDGAYVVRLVVNDGTVDSSPDTVTINATTGNSAPVANAGPDQNVSTGELVTLDGSASSDADGDTLTYLWNFVSVPAGSSVNSTSLSDLTVANPTFTPDVDGAYVVQLVVNDGTVDSTPDNVTINSQTPNVNLNVFISPSGSGSVIPNPAGTGCGTNCWIYPLGTPVEITPDPAGGYDFDHWSGCDSTTDNVCKVTMNSPRSITAYFYEMIPDIQIYKGPNPYSFTADSVGYIGGDVYVYASIWNLGSESAYNFRVWFYLSNDSGITSFDTPLGGCNRSVLASFAGFVCSGYVQIPLSVTPGSWYIGVFADDTNAVDESDEGNNTRSRTITISN
jgi:hypothetical protein